MLIYKATNLFTGLSYVGQTIKVLKHRIRSHVVDSRLKNDAMIFHKAIRKYGSASFNWEILEDGIGSYDELDSKETFYILKHDTFIPNGYNMVLGGPSKRGYVNSPETRKKIGSANRGKLVSEETKKIMSEYGKKRKHTQQELEKMKISMTGKRHTEQTKSLLSISAKNRYLLIKNPLIGLKQSEEFCEKLRNAWKKRSRVFSEETRNKMRISHTGLTPTTASINKRWVSRCGFDTTVTTKEEVMLIISNSRPVLACFILHNRKAIEKELRLNNAINTLIYFFISYSIHKHICHSTNVRFTKF